MKRAAVALMVLTAALVLDVGKTLAVAVHETMADNRPVQAGPVRPGFPIDYVAVLWDDTHSHEGAAVRFGRGHSWGPWIPFEEDGASVEGQFGSGLVAGNDADAYQVRGVPAAGRNPRAVAINTTDGPVSREVALPGRAAGALPNCRSRADWGADETLMTWTPSFSNVQVLTVHHTATANNDTDPAATMRAIYRYHAVDRGWGDIGYQYVVDSHGVVYEGRSSGAPSASCLTGGGDGSDFGHDDQNRGVTGAHVGGWNSGNLGAALMGTFTDVAPPSAQVSGLETLLSELARRHSIDPLVLEYRFVKPANGATKTVPTISGHRDWAVTECPGGRLYAALPAIRSHVAADLDSPTTTTSTPTSSTTTTLPRSTTTTLPRKTTTTITRATSTTITRPTTTTIRRKGAPRT